MIYTVIDSIKGSPENLAAECDLRHVIAAKKKKTTDCLIAGGLSN